MLNSIILAISMTAAADPLIDSAGGDNGDARFRQRIVVRQRVVNVRTVTVNTGFAAPVFVQPTFVHQEFLVTPVIAVNSFAFATPVIAVNVRSFGLFRPFGFRQVIRVR